MGDTGRRCGFGAWVAHLNSRSLDFTQLRNGLKRRYVSGHVLRDAIRPKINNDYRTGLRQPLPTASPLPNKASGPLLSLILSEHFLLLPPLAAMFPARVTLPRKQLRQLLLGPQPAAICALAGRSFTLEAGLRSLRGFEQGSSV